MVETNSGHEYPENHELQGLSESQLDMAPVLDRVYQAVADLQREEEPLVNAHDDLVDIPPKCMLSHSPRT